MTQDAAVFLNYVYKASVCVVKVCLHWPPMIDFEVSASMLKLYLIN